MDECVSDSDIIIKPADKGGATVVLNRDDYVQEAVRQLSNEVYYQRLDADPTHHFVKELQDVVDSCSPATRSKLRHMIPANPKPGVFYIVPKIHKENNPGRPIVSGLGTLTEKLSGFVSELLSPVASNVNSFIQDTTHFLNILENFNSDHQFSNDLLVTMDVHSLYTNIPHEDGIEASVNAYNQFYNEGDRIISGQDLAKIMRYTLTHNYFVFDNVFYLQVMGTAMGTRMAPPYAILFLAQLENNFLANYRDKPTVFYRYIDDIFMIWSYGLDRLNDFHREFDNAHTTIKFDCLSSKVSINFLDTTVSFDGNRLKCTLFRKPTDRNTLLRYDSFHPSHIKRSIVYSQALRIIRICSKPVDAIRELDDLCGRLLNRGYSIDIINNGINKARQLSRDALLRYQTRDKSNDFVPFITTYHPLNFQIRKILKNLYPILQDPTLINVFPKSPSLVFRQPPSCRSSLVSSLFHSQVNNELGTFPCGKPRCLTCKHISSNTEFFYNGIRLHISDTYNCGSTGVVYLIYCSSCPDAWYFGETSTALRTRLNGHRQTITNHNIGVPVGEHFNHPGHSLDDLRVLVVAGSLPDIHLRKKREVSFILKFQTHVLGLNRDIGFASHYRVLLD